MEVEISGAQVAEEVAQFVSAMGSDCGRNSGIVGALADTQDGSCVSKPWSLGDTATPLPPAVSGERSWGGVCGMEVVEYEV